MTSLIAELNELLRLERGELEAVAELIRELRASEPDIADGAGDVLQTASWSCQGLSHRIEWLGGTPTLDVVDRQADLQDRTGTQDKIRFLCEAQSSDLARVESLLSRTILDKDTRDFLNDLLKAHQATVQWCERVLAEWKTAG